MEQYKAFKEYTQARDEKQYALNFVVYRDIIVLSFKIQLSILMI